MSKINRRQFSNRAAASLGLALAHPAVSQAASAQRVKNGVGLPSAGSLTDVPGIKAGHFTHPQRPTGCTMIVMEEGAATGVDFGGSSHGGQQTILLEPVTSIQSTWGISISGGGAFGMAASWGLIRYLAEHKVGYYGGAVPLISAAVVYDFGIDGDMSIRPDAEGGYQASQTAAKAAPLEEGCVGAGAGATVGTMLTSQGIHGMKGGVGTASVKVGDVIVGALAIANTAGDIVDWRNGNIIAGARRADSKGFVGIAQAVLKNPPKLLRTSANDIDDPVFQSGVVGVVATNAPFTKTELCKLAINAGAGAARTVNPYHTQGDGNTVFAISTNKVKTDLSLSVIGTLAAEALSLAILRSVMLASSLENWPSYRDYTAKLRRRA
ncbi:MAG TPA: P1 family peptidase [Bryobacteraceae bacterium]|nr:P1 family peptidase [Bryobacteraceae bacterium]